MHSKPFLTIDYAKLIGEGCLSKASEQNWNVCVAVCDEGGHLLWLNRSHEVPPVSSIIAANKARTAAMGRRESKVYEDQINNGRYAFLSAPDITALMEGGVPIIINSFCIGAVAVSNLKPAEDSLVAKAGIDLFINQINNENS